MLLTWTLCLGVGASLLSGVSGAEDLLMVYDRALANDPQIREADATRRAARETRPQAIASLLPQINGTGTIRSRSETDGTSINTQTLLGGGTNVIDNGGNTTTNTRNIWNLQLRQNLFSWANWSTLRASSHQVAQAESDFVVAQQSLVQRVASLYFSVLAAQDDVEANEAARDAITRQLDQADKRFEVGLIAITDVQEARAARDQAAAAAIASKRALASAQEQLRAVTGEKYNVLNKPADTMPLLTPAPASEDEWVKISMDQNAALTSSRLGADIARDQVRVQFGGHLPTVDLVVGRSHNQSDSTQIPLTGAQRLSEVDTDGKSISLQFTLPIFSGGATQSRVRQSQFQWIAAKERLERSSRDTERSARDAYLGVISEISRVQALKQALESSQTALRATEAGYEVGTRTAVDVLDARRALIQAQTNYSQSRYAYLNNVIALRFASGDLDRATIEEINKWLTEPQVAPAPNPVPPSP
ncbi:MAG: TolC family outer membrane protein [Steroidobacteraceae bacterium]